MILGLGTDIIENERIERIYRSFKNRFLNRIFTEQEIEYSISHSDPIPYLAGRFAVKEAAIKALNLQGSAGFAWKDIEVCGQIFGKKRLAFHNGAQRVADRLCVEKSHISLSHSNSLSIAVVILENMQNQIQIRAKSLDSKQ